MKILEPSHRLLYAATCPSNGFEAERHGEGGPHHHSYAYTARSRVCLGRSVNEDANHRRLHLAIMAVLRIDGKTKLVRSRDVRQIIDIDDFRRGQLGLLLR